MTLIPRAQVMTTQETLTWAVPQGARALAPAMARRARAAWEASQTNLRKWILTRPFLSTMTCLNSQVEQRKRHSMACPNIIWRASISRWPTRFNLRTPIKRPLISTVWNRWITSSDQSETRRTGWPSASSFSCISRVFYHLRSSFKSMMISFNRN